MNQQPKVDPITRSVVEHRFSSIIAQMGEAMLRTSYSQILNASRDFSIAICDTEGMLVAQADHLPIHVGALPWATHAVEEAIKDIQPGDVFLINDPHNGGSHLPDVTAFVPVFAGDRRLFWTIVRAHMSDIGGSTHGGYNPSATDIWQEGIRLPPVRLYEAGRLREDLLKVLELNVRNGRDFLGDLAAMVGAARLGEARLQDLFKEIDVDVILGAVDLILDSAEKHARQVVSTWKDGVFLGEAFLEDDGHGTENIRIAAKVTKNGDSVEIDLTRSDEQTRGFVNSSHANMQAAVAMAFAYLLDPQIPKNSGAFRPLSVVANKGTIVWADDDRPVCFCTSHPANEIVEAIVKALSASCPDRTMAGWCRRFRLAMEGVDPRNGHKFIWHMFHARPGGGASPAGDGWSCGGEGHIVGGAKFGSIEVAEVRFPLHFRKHEFRQDSGGDGEYRGGLGVDLELLIETETPVSVNTAGEGVRYGACGLLGGEAGAPHCYRVLSDDREPRDLPTKAVGIEIQPRDVLEIRSAGGGGWGSPSKRSPKAIQRDIEAGLVDGRIGRP